MTFVSHSLAAPIIYVSPGPHDTPVRGGHLAVAEAGLASRHEYPVEKAALAADAIAVSLAAALNQVTAPLARAAAAFVEGETEGAWASFGYARLDDHARERFGRSGRSLRDLAALGAAMARMPRLERALKGDDGGMPLDRTAAVLVARVARAETVDHWIECARRLTVRELRGAIRVAREQEGPAEEEYRPGRLVRFLVPAATKGIFEEALELFRAVEGCDASVASFFEALAAEGMTGPATVPEWEVESAPLETADRRAVVERAHKESTGNWSRLPRAGPGDWALRLAGATLRSFAALCERAGTGDAVELDGQIRELQQLEDEMERRLADLLATMADQGAWSRLRFDGSGHYAEERLRISRTVASDRIRAARGLRRLVVIRRAYERGEIALEPVLHIIRILRDTLPDSRTQQAWVCRAREATVKRMRDEAREIERRRLSAAAGPIDRTPLDDTAWRSSLWREPGLARQRTESLGRLVTGDTRPDVFLRVRLADDIARALLAAVESRRGALARHVEQVAWDQPWPEANPAASVRVARELFVRCRRIPAWLGLMSLLEEFVQTWDPPVDAVRRRSDAVYARAGWRCSAPGCSSRRNLEDHHLVYRARGGSDELWNRECLCRFHHQRGEHGGLSRCRGRAPLGVTWRLGRERAATWWRNELRSRSPSERESPADTGASPRSSR